MILRIEKYERNAYPNWFINKIITKFEDRNFNNTNGCNFSNTQEMEKEFAFTFGIHLVSQVKKHSPHKIPNAFILYNVPCCPSGEQHTHHTFIELECYKIKPSE